MEQVDQGREQGLAALRVVLGVVRVARRGAGAVSRLRARRGPPRQHRGLTCQGGVDDPHAELDRADDRVGHDVDRRRRKLLHRVPGTLGDLGVGTFIISFSGPASLQRHDPTSRAGHTLSCTPIPEEPLSGAESRLGCTRVSGPTPPAGVVSQAQPRCAPTRSCGEDVDDHVLRATIVSGDPGTTSGAALTVTAVRGGLARASDHGDRMGMAVAAA
jgi:hypothetical protein